MNIVFVCNNFIEEYETIIKNIEDTMKTIIYDKDIKFLRKDKVSLRYKSDVIVILLPDNYDVSKFFVSSNSINKCIVLIEKINEKTITDVVKYTKNICYMKNEAKLICKRIYGVYLESCDIFE